ncbi:tRNA (5-methylaminomethyl-2-thiouridine)(34)-methyltransferase MnmD [Marinilabilia salmonicolor]|uniref:tRNA U34 5-methylaminomethyl-2-thiouridine-forming methyltransferase MnmC n=1 Tax=Marinilabilia salmonicolor TaxID=989 RepID=A0A368V0E6_9BACT|nr:tRNA (5-methylaminomethyl-2-thiouridine)(34)-methyltransferase MnmD [Marinilabilia salmonicolor]RCW32481.1 tRNA U34 5-methylaminomethyl-2-thiouridine-forming methyltransferase MnmC [Marinilabilia salmonicolor]
MHPQNTPKVELRTSEDGSSTLYRPDLDEHYHSIHGAIQESMHVFIRAGLLSHQANALNILEVGFGTGLNALLTILHQGKKKVFYHTIERYPLEATIVQSINYPDILDVPTSTEYFKQLHEAPWNKDCEITPAFTIHKEASDLALFTPQKLYNLVYFDAFGPDKQPELWTPEIFKKISESMCEGGVLVTYSCKGTVKRALSAAGMKIEKIPGPPGKREMLRATKI